MKNDKTKNSNFHLDFILDKECKLVGKYGFPQLNKENHIPYNVSAFHASEMKTRGKWCHFFMDDYRYTGIWNNFDRYLEQLKSYDGVITTDYSMFLDTPLALNVWNCYRNRVLSFEMQQAGIKVIPVAGWTDQDSYSWCFDGLPKESTIAVSTNGCFSEEGKKAYVEGLKAMCDIINPSLIVCVGKPIEDSSLDINTEIRYYDTEIIKFRKGL